MGADGQKDHEIPDREPLAETQWGTVRRVESPVVRAFYKIISIWDKPVTWMRGEWDCCCGL